ncbi:MAG: YfhO family protein [Lachnospiraceae bacterium]|nr:YfhO family protein [Lachnospiraceae bacterium]
MLLYSRFLISNRTYIYIDDIGADSFSASLPIISMLGRLARQGIFGGFSLQAGLGYDLTALAAKYLNPLKAPLLLFDRSNLWLGLLLELFLQTNVIALSSWFFFRRLLRDRRAAAYAVLAWTFSGYITLWSQNLTAGSCMAMFSLMMAALLPMCEAPTLRRWLGLSMAAGLFLLTNYYYCYMSAFFCFLFYVLYSLRRKEGMKNFFGRGVLVVSAVLFACGLAMIGLIPSFSDFAGSVRSSWVGNASSGLRLLNRKEILTALGRLLSVNAFGVGDGYSGMSNYYEEAVLSTSLLVFPAVLYLLLEKKTRLLTGFCTVLSVLAVLIKNTGAILQFNANAQRYSYMIAYASALAIGAAVKAYTEDPDARKLRLSAVLSFILEAGLVLLLYLQAREPGCYMHKKTLLMVLGFAVLYTAVLFIAGGRFKQDQAEAREAVIGRNAAARMGLVLTVLLVLELVVMNYATLYHRVYVQKSDYAAALDDYGIGTAAAELQAQDDGLYRISAADSSDFNNVLFSNAGMLLGFPAVSVYSSTNPSSLASLTGSLSSSELTQNHFFADGTELGLFQLLAGKYLIRSNTEHSANSLPKAFYERIGETEDGSKAVYRIKTALPFGYLYTEEMQTEEALKMSLPERMAALGEAYFLTPDAKRLAEAGKRAKKEKADWEDAFASKTALLQVTDLLSTGGRDANDVEQVEEEGYTSFQCKGGDPYLYYSVGAQKEGTWRALYIRQAKSNPYPNEVRQLQLFYMSEGDTQPDPNDTLFFTMQADCPETMVILPDDITEFRMDFPQDGSRTDVQQMEILEFSDQTDFYEQLSQTAVSEIRMEGGVYSAALESEQDGMFCVPVLWSESWKASVNGEETEVCNINGGFVGIRVGAGSSRIELRYETPQFTAAAVGSGICAAVWLFLLVMSFVVFERKKKHEA